MYRLDWIEQLKLRAVPLPSGQQTTAVSPVVWNLGLTSLLTDISSEMVNSMLPVYLVLYLHVSPLAFGAVDGVYNGMAVALLSIAGGMLADRSRRHKEVAAAGYGLSCICKLALAAAGAATGWIAAIVAVDRVGKGVRTAPRDAILSLNSEPHMLATSFAVHRAMDAGGSLLGPIAAFLLISQMPNAYDAIWVTSFVVALLGVAALWLFVDNPEPRMPASSAKASLGSAFQFAASNPAYRSVTLIAGFLGIATISDAFVYLILQQQSGAQAEYFPLYYVATAATYMLFSLPVGRIADRFGRMPVLLAGYGVLGAVYMTLAWGNWTGALVIVPLVLLGIYYAATEGVLMAIASSTIPESLRTTGLALITTSIGLGKLVSSVFFGWFWQAQGTRTTLAGFLILLLVTLVLAARQLSHLESHE